MATPKKSQALVSSKSRFRWPLALAVVAVVGAVGAVVVWKSFAASGALALSSSIAGNSVGLGTAFAVTVTSNSGVDAVNAVQANLSYPTAQLRLDSVDVSTSGFATQAVNTFGGGTATIARGQVPPGLTGSQTVAILRFTAIGTGSAPIAFTSGSMLVSSSSNTNILVSSPSLTLTVTDSVAPSTPAAPTASGTTMTSTTLTWPAATDNVGVSGYRVYRNGAQVGTTAASVLSYTDTALTPATPYTYTVAAVDAAGNLSAKSAGTGVTTLGDTAAPSVPGAAVIGTRTISSVTFSWAASTDNVGVTSYRIYRNGAEIAKPATPSYTDTGLAPNTALSYRIAATDAAGNLSAQSTAVATSSLPDTAAPSTPTAPVSTVSGSNVVLTWTASTDNVGVAGYRVMRDGAQIATVPSGLTYTDAARPAGTYQYSLSAYDAAGNVSSVSAASTAILRNKADLNADGAVNLLDLSRLLSGWGGAGASDINGDGTTNILDLSQLLSAWS